MIIVFVIFTFSFKACEYFFKEVIEGMPSSNTAGMDGISLQLLQMSTDAVADILFSIMNSTGE